MSSWTSRVVRCGALAAAMALAASGATAEPFECRAIETAGLPPQDAATAVDVVCRELADASGSAGQYGVSLRPLGSSLVLTVTRGGTAEGRSLVLDGFREVPTAARRLADALASGRPVEDTQRVDNLVESEGRKLVTRSGSRKFEIGAMGMGAGQGTGTGAGFSLGFAYDTPSFAIPAELRFSQSGDDGNRRVSMFSIGTGPRYYFSRRDTSAFVGGGLSVLALSYSENSSWESGAYLEDSHWGPGLYAEAGLQVFRTHRGRMTAKVRTDLPLYSLHPQGYHWDPRGPSAPVVGKDLYLAPVTFGLTMSF